MKSQLIIGSIVIALAFIVVPTAGAIDLVPDITGVTNEMPWDSFATCGPDLPTEAVFNDPVHPGWLVYVSLLCPADAAPDQISVAATGCASTEYSFWASTHTTAWKYTYDTTNPFGFSQSAVASAWDGANTVWDSQVSASLFSGHVFGGSGSNVGRGDGVNQAGFKHLSGNAIAVQYAWTSGGKMVETDSGYNTGLALGMNGESNKYDVQGVAAQEMGHGNGMGHSSTASSASCLTMYPYGVLGDTSKRTLGDGDILGIKARYP